MPPRVSQLDEVRLSILVPLRERLQAARFGEKTKLVKAAAAALGCVPQTIYTDLAGLEYDTARATRKDAGTSMVTDAEVFDVASIVATAYRENNKRLMSIGNAMKHARANGLLWTQCSATTMARRMRELNLHPDQVERAPAHVNLMSAYPNQVWQLDPSLCVMYRMPNGKVGIVSLDDELIYKNKLENLEILNTRNKVWRYVQYDHYTGAFAFRYFETPGESAEVLLEFLIWATSKRPGFLMHGWPELILWDKGSANRAAVVRNLLGHLGVRHQTHKAKNARAKGGVENSNNLVEIGFESQLVFADIPTVELLNARAEAWQIDFNSMEVHSRHGHTRYGLWQTIREDQLRISPPPERLRLLANTEPVERQVNGDLSVSLDGRLFDVSHVSQISAGDKVRVAQNAYSRESVWVLTRDEKKVEQYHACPQLTKNEGGFWSNGVQIGEFRALEDRPVDKARRDLREAVWGTRDENEAVAARRKGRLPMEGRVDPFKHVEDRKAQLPEYMQRRGTDLHLPSAMQVEDKPMTVTDALFALNSRFGRSLERAEAEAVRAWFPNGLAHDQFDSLVERLEQLGNAAGASPVTEKPRLVAVR